MAQARIEPGTLRIRNLTHTTEQSTHNDGNGLVLCGVNFQFTVLSSLLKLIRQQDFWWLSVAVLRLTWCPQEDHSFTKFSWSQKHLVIVSSISVRELALEISENTFFLGRKMPLSVAVKNSLSIKIEKDTHRSSIIMRHLTFKCKPSLQHSHLFTRFNSNSNHFAQRVHVFYFYNIVCAVSYSSDLI